MDNASVAMTGRFVMPVGVSIEMMQFARPQGDDLWHWANNLSAMLRLGYCRKCGLVTDGCKREGCRSNKEVPDESK